MYFYIGHSLFIIISKPMRKLIFLLTFYLLFTSILAEDDEQKVEQVDIGIKRTFRLTGTAPFVGHYVLSVKEDSIPKNQDKWYLFAMAEPKQSSTEVFGSPSKIEISKIGSSGSATKIKDCGIVEDSDACFIKNSEFEYKTDKIRVSVHCQKQCEFQFLAEVDQAYPLQLNKNFKLDFEDTAYSKIFTLSTEGHDFYELRILLQPKGFIKYGEPVVLLANYGNQVPSRDKYDLKGLHTWDDGQGIFLRKSEMKERTLTILVEGPQKNVLNLQAIGWQKQQKITMMQYWPQFDYLKTGQYRQFLLPIVANLTHRVKVITFSGSVSLAKVQKVSDEGIITTTSALNYSMPDSKYGQFQFRISKEIIQKQKISKILVRVEANKQSTYVLNFAREEQAISSLLPFISQSSIMELKQTDQYYIKVEELIEETKQKKSSTIELIVGNINGNIKTRFYKCNVAHKTGSDNAKNCEITATNKQDFTEVSPVKFQSRGSEERSWFNIQWLDYVKKTDKDKTQIVYQLVVVLQNANEKGQSSYQIQYKNKDRIYLLKEGELIKDRVFINQKRHYKLSLLDSDATQIRIHCTRISGDAIFKGSLVDPRVNKDFSAILPEYSVITFKIPADQKQTEVFLQVKGLQVSYYSLTTQVIRKSEASPTKKNGTGYNQLIVREQTPYEFVIGAKESIVVQIHATQNTFNLNLKSSASVQVCMTQNLANPPYAPNCEIRNDYFLEMNEILNMDRGLVGNIGIKNNNDFNVTIKLLITKLQKDTKKEDNATETSTQTCQLALMNEVMFKLLDSNGKDVEGDIHHCIQYNLNKNAEVQLIVELNKDYQYNEGKIIANINGQQKIQILSPSHIFTKEQVQKACSAQKKHGEPETFCYLKVKFSGLKKTRVRVLAQYTDRSIRLMDGVAHSVHGVVKKIQPRLFYFAVHNYQNVTIVLENKVGEYKIYANVMKYSEFAEQSEKNNTQIYPTAAASNFQSANPFYYLEQIINIPKDIITQKCKHDNDAGSLFGRKWVDCVILISVGLQGDQEIQKNGKFVIEATQKNRELKENVATSGYLQKKSVAFYHYQNQVPNGTLIVNVNNQNKFCLDIYVKEGTQRASSGSYDKHAKASNTVILNKTAVTSYSITVQANDNCPYTIEVSTAKNNIGRIKKGTFTDINLKLNEQKNFLFENLINETFKILTLHKNGQVIISVKSIPREKLKQVINSDISQTKDWTWSNKDSVRINNNNERNGKLVANPNYCVDCYYLINIKAQRDTEASIIIPTPDTELPITTDSQIKDLLQKNESEIFRIFTESNSQFQIYVQYGKVKISISQSTNKDVIVFDKVFQASKAPVVQPFNLSDSKQTYEFLRYSRITIRAEEQSFFSFAIISNSDPEKRSQSGLKYGLPQYLYLQQNKQKCVVGFMTASIDQFLFSFSKADKDIIQNTEIVLRINEKIVKYQKQLGNNEMILNVTQSILGVQASANRKFHLCMKSKKSVAVTVIQSSPLRYWPEKQSIVVKKQSNLTFGAEGRTIIEINQCKSRASAEVFSEFNEMKSTSSIIKQRRRSNNIVQFYGYGAIYIKVKAEKATLKWMTANEAEGKGLGYDEFKSSWIRVLKQGNKIEVTVDPIQYISQKQAHSKLTAISYSFYAAKQEMEMYSSMNCGEGQFSLQTKLINLTSNQLASKQLVKVQFNIQNDLKPKFEKYSYFLVGVKAEVTSTLPNGQTENYRFFYPYQQISKEMLSGSGQIGPYVPEEQGEGSILETIGYALVVIIVFLAIYHVYNKIVKRCRTKRQRVNESMGKEMKYFDLTEN